MFKGSVAIGVLCVLAPVYAQAQALAPTITKSFFPPTIPPGGTSVLSLTFANPNAATTLTNVSVSDTLPAGVTATAFGSPSFIGCATGSSQGILNGGTIISAATPSLAAGSSCTLTWVVTAGSPGVFVNTTGNVTSTQATGGTASATLLVAAEDAFQVNYVSNLDLGDGTINVTNAGSQWGTNGATGNLCANIYVFSPDEQLQACCSCFVSPNGLISFAVVGNNNQGIPFRNPAGGVSGILLNNPFFAAPPPPYLSEWNSAVIKILFTNAGTGPSSCVNTATPSNTAANVTVGNLAAGGTAWGTHSHPTNAPAVAITETQFVNRGLTVLELNKTSQVCNQLFSASSGRGLCTCPTGPGGLAVPVANNRPASALRPGL